MTERFELLAQLGRGGMGTVWRARDQGTGEIVAVKILHPHLVDDPDMVARVEREVELSKTVASPFVVATRGFGVKDGNPYIVMEYIAGQSLRDLLKVRRWLPWAEARPILNDIAGGIRALHGAGIMHRDISPGNVLIDGHGRAKLADLGSALSADVTRLTNAGAILGTPSYLAPDIPYVPASDFYSLGCLAYEVLTGYPPFSVSTVQEAALLHSRGIPNLDALPPESREVVGGLLQKDPVARQRFVEARFTQRASPPPQYGDSAPTVVQLPSRQVAERRLWSAAIRSFLVLSGLGCAIVVIVWMTVS